MASTSIGEGNLNIKFRGKTDKDLEKLNMNFNLMIDKLKNQQEKLIANERHEHGNLARKLAHEIKNPLHQYNLKQKQIRQWIRWKKKENFKENLIINQIKQIEKLVNEFSDFAGLNQH